MRGTHDPGFDVVRVIAMIFVVAVHTLFVVDVASRSGYVFDLTGRSLFLSANALFFLLSGKLNIRVIPDEKIGAYYFKKVRNILIPVLVFFLAFTLYSSYPAYDIVATLKAFLVGALGGYAGMAYWFMFSLVGFLLVAPFLGRAFDRMGDRTLAAFIILGFGFSVARTIAGNIGIGFSWGYPFEGFFFTFCLGAVLDRIISTDRRFWLLMVLSAVCFLASVLLVAGGYGVGAYDVSPLYTIYSVGLFVLIARTGRRVLERFPLAERACAVVAKRSFSVYMVHVMLLVPLSAPFVGYGGIVSIFAQMGFTIVTLAASLVLSVLADLLVVGPLQRLLDRARRRAAV
ncbi:acyltransferase [Adlercreutzia faecimuris]|uniref:Acyltransferase n=1 Tax=Adlercreutzia faecimuris TaxID=2897341 RepID=A0ABS9WFX8_9ACTN|nr:acyltransferase [Adlercreutzia sp. JBNU-10]MCI2241766.1 acyltransferase [Adlercreutzia sp. JBNU-10]